MNAMGAVALPLSLLLLWALVTVTGTVDALFLPPPWAVGKAVYAEFLLGTLARDLLATLGRAFAGFGLSAAIGVPLGLVIGRVPVLARATQPVIDFFRSIPATALFPLFLFFFGVGDQAKVAVVVYACSLLVLVNTAYGAMQVKKARIVSAQIMGAGPGAVFWKIVLPESAPGVLAGLRVALSMAFVLVVVTEMFIGTNVGLGHHIVNAQMVYRVPEMYAGIVVTGVVGYAANALLVYSERRYLHWVGR